MALNRRIAAFCESAVGGAERVLLEYCSYLASRGWDVRVIVGGHLDPERRRIWQEWGPGLDFIELPWRRRTEYAFPVILPSLDRKAVGGLRLLLEELRPDLVLVNQPGPDDAQGALRAGAILRPKVPVVCLVHMPARGLRVRLRRTKRWWAGRLYRRVDGIITNSQATASYLAEDYALPAGKVEVVWNGVKDVGSARPQDELLRTRGELGVEDHDVVVLWAGRFTIEKGVDVLLSSLELLPPSPRIRCVLAGDGPLRVGLMAGFRPLVDSGRVVFAGWRRDVRFLLHACDIAVMPSRIESFGLFIAEAMAASKPVVATNVYGIPDVVSDGATGLLVPPDDPPALAAAVERLATDPALRENMGRAGRRRYEDHFAFEKAADRFERALLEALDGS